VNGQRIGALFRAVRRKRGLRQADVATAAGVSDSTVSRVERGHWQSLSFETVERLASVLEIRVDVTAFWRGGDANRLLSRGHSLLAESLAATISTLQTWVFEPEVSFSIRGERGVIDQLGWRAASRDLLVIELKTEFVDVNEALGTLDRKMRLARAVARQRGWEAADVSCWLVVLDTRTNRRHAHEHSALLRAKFPCDGRHLRRVLREPSGETRGVAFWPDSRRRGLGQEAGGAKSRIRPANPG
jgi:transcriptional regulator with XRE-family HTH domain